LVTVTPASFTFSYTKGDTTGSVTVPVGTGGQTLCSNPIAVAGGTWTIQETGISPTYSVVSITELPGGTYLTTNSPSTATAKVAVDGITAEVTYTNQVNTGYLEICKSTPPGSGLAGPFTFNVAGPTGTNFTTSQVVPVGTCSNPFLAPVGNNTITEAGTNLYVTGITANLNLNSANSELVSANTTTGTAVVTVVPAVAVGNSSNQTDVTYTNNVVSLEVCKAFDSWTVPTPTPNPITASTLYPFTFATAAGPFTGPTSAPITAGPAVNIPAGSCSNPVSYLPGTSVTVTEGIVPGSKVKTIAATGAVSQTSQSTANRTITIVIGTPTMIGAVANTAAPTNSAIVTFTNEYANPGTLKICKMAGTIPGPPIGTSFTFTINGGTALTTVPLGQCSIVGTTNPDGSITPTWFPYNSVVNVLENGTSGNVASAITIVPTFVSLASPFTVTNVSTQASQTLGTAPGSSSSEGVRISESATTEVTFTNVDPPVVGDSPVTVANPVSSVTTLAGPGTTTAFSFGSATAVASTIPALVTSKTGSLPALTVPKMTAAQRKAALKKDEKSLSNLNAAIAKENRLLAGKLKSSVRKTDLRRLSQLKSERNLLNQMIKALKK